MIYSDLKKLKQVLLNLLGNAIKFTRQGMVKLIVNFSLNSNIIEFKVIDEGIGIKPDKIGKL